MNIEVIESPTTQSIVTDSSISKVTVIHGKVEITVIDMEA